MIVREQEGYSMRDIRREEEMAREKYMDNRVRRLKERRVTKQVYV